MSDNKVIMDYMNRNYTEIQPKAFYRAIFPQGELESKGKHEKGKYNAVAVELLPKGKTAFKTSPDFSVDRRRVPSPTSCIRNHTSLRFTSTKLTDIGLRKKVVGEPSTRNSAN